MGTLTPLSFPPAAQLDGFFGRFEPVLYRHKALISHCLLVLFLPF